MIHQLVQTMFIIISNLLHVSFMYPFTFSSHPVDTVNAFGAVDFCKKENGSLLRLTENALYDIKSYVRKTDADVSIVLTWTNLVASREGFDMDKLKAGEFPLDHAIQDDDGMCIYASIQMSTGRITWITRECSLNLDGVTLFCHHHDKYYAVTGFVPWCSTLTKEGQSWEEADNYCRSKDSKLIEVDDVGRFERRMQYLFHLSNWKTQFVEYFWVGQKTRTATYFDKPLNILLERIKTEGTECAVISVNTETAGFVDFKWTNQYCDRKESFICVSSVNRNDINFLRLKDTYYPLYTIQNDGLPYSIDECKAQAIKLNHDGIMCGGFNYKKSTSSCLFFGYSFYYYVSILNNPSYDVIIMSDTIGQAEYNHTYGGSYEYECQSHQSSTIQASTTEPTTTESETTTQIQSQIKSSEVSESDNESTGVVSTIAMSLISAASFFTSIGLMVNSIIGSTYQEQAEDDSDAGNGEADEIDTNEGLSEDEFTIEIQENFYENIPPPGFLLPKLSVKSVRNNPVL